MTESDLSEDRLLESVQLPEGLTRRQWAEEKVRWQNPRIRSLLGCSALIESVYESNQAILSCSPERLAEIWDAVRKVSFLLVDEVIPLLEGPSVIPRLEEARQRTELAARVIASTVVDDVGQMPEQIEEERRKEFRKLLCIALGQLHDFLQDAFADLMANDPRSFHDSGYFLSRRFRRDVEEAEWLMATVDSLESELATYERRRQRDLSALLSSSVGRDEPPDEEALRAPSELLHDLVDQLTPRLKEASALRGIRFAELEVVDGWASDLPTHCHVVLELWEVARRAPPSDDEVGARWQRLVAERVRARLIALDGLLKDLLTFLPLWRLGIANRRALVFRRGESGEAER